MSWIHGENLLGGDGVPRVDNVYMRVRGTTACGFCRRELDVASETLRSDLTHDYGISFQAEQTDKWSQPLFRSKWDTSPGQDEALGWHFLRSEDELAPIFERHVKVCGVCGWWVAFEETLKRTDHLVTVRSYAGAGAIKTLNLRDIEAPLNEVRAYLAGRYEERHKMDPALFERTVASVFKDLGFRTRATGCSGDGGIDVVLQDASGVEIGVQVKRYRNTIQVNQIRELTGALVLKGLTKGIFVTTSAFTSGAPGVADLSALRGHPIELIDAPKFLEKLEIAQRSVAAQPDDETAPWRRRRLLKVHERVGSDFATNFSSR